MALPVLALDRSTVDLGGSPVEFRSLSRSEVVALAGFASDTNAAEVFMLSRACGISEDEASVWRDSVSATAAGVLLSAIATLSGLAGPSGNA